VPTSSSYYRTSVNAVGRVNRARLDWLVRHLPQETDELFERASYAVQAKAREFAPRSDKSGNTPPRRQPNQPQFGGVSIVEGIRRTRGGPSHYIVRSTAIQAQYFRSGTRPHVIRATGRSSVRQRAPSRSIGKRIRALEAEHVRLVEGVTGGNVRSRQNRAVTLKLPEGGRQTIHTGAATTTKRKLTAAQVRDRNRRMGDIQDQIAYLQGAQAKSTGRRLLVFYWLKAGVTFRGPVVSHPGGPAVNYMERAQYVVALTLRSKLAALFTAANVPQRTFR
jgi:hypothetical protein